MSDIKEDSAGEGFKKIDIIIPVKEGRTITDEILGQSDGSSNQVFQLAQPKLLRDSLTLIVQNGEEIEEWFQRDNLIYSRSPDNHYSIQIDENDMTRIYFGDGTYGKVPPNGARITVTYRVGGGVHGNVEANKITVISTESQLQALAAEVTNEKPASGGAERESIQHAVKFAPTVFKSLQRGVSREDYTALAKQFPGVAKAKAEAANWNYIDLYIAPSGGGECTDILKTDLLAYFEDFRMMTALVRIKDPAYVPVFITAEVKVKSYYFQEDVRRQVESAIKEHVLDFDLLDFAQPVYLSKVYEAIENIGGVDYVNISEFRRDTPAQIYESTDPGYKTDRAIEATGMIKTQTYEIPRQGHTNFIRTIMSGGY